jgi:serine protease Do
MKPTLLLALLALPSLAAQELKPEEIYQRLLPSIVTLNVETRTGEHYVGTAFLGLADDVAVTSWHVIADARKVTARFADNEFVDVPALVDKDEKTDLALVRLAASCRPLVQINASNAPIGSRAYVIGAPKGYGFSIADGLISQVQDVAGIKQYQISCPISGGNSGGPLVNQHGEVIGITSWSKTDAQNLNFAAPASGLSTLNPSSSPKLWADLDKSSPPQPTAVTAAKAGDAAKASDSENALVRFIHSLQSAAGEEVTLIVKQKGRQESFTFVVPAGLAGDE